MNDLPWTDTAHHGRPAQAAGLAWTPRRTDTALDWPAREPVRRAGRPARATPRRRAVAAALARLRAAVNAAACGGRTTPPEGDPR